MSPINPTAQHVTSSLPEQPSTNWPVGTRLKDAAQLALKGISPALQNPKILSDVVTQAPIKPFIPETTDRPILPPPDFSPSLPLTPTTPPTLSELQFLAAMETFRSFANDLLVNFGVRLEGHRLNLQEITTENIKKLKESAENAKSADFWSLLKKVATSLLSALSVVIGISLVATGAGALVGGAMIGSGIVSLANMLMSETGIWDWVTKKLAHEDQERQQMLATLLPCAVGILAGAIGVFGSAGAFAWSGINFVDKAILIAQTGLAIFDSATTIGKGYTDAKTIWLRADLTDTTGKTTIERQMINKTTSSIENVLDELKMANEKSADFVKMAIRSNQAAVEVFG